MTAPDWTTRLNNDGDQWRGLIVVGNVITLQAVLLLAVLLRRHTQYQNGNLAMSLCLEAALRKSDENSKNTDMA
ncbi:hypothetical protein BS17DRAFT_554730 [Gyrodon lividus]|nr:hypothetical protein BS17DRAFT_554730 [Gyrodon lividus]